MKKIDAHSHIGNFGGWAGVAFTKQKLIEQMDEYDIEKTFLTAPNFQGNDEVVDAFQSYPDKIVPFVWVNPALDDVEKKLNHYINEEGFMGIKMQPLFDAFVADDPVVYPVMDFAWNMMYLYLFTAVTRLSHFRGALHFLLKNTLM